MKSSPTTYQAPALEKGLDIIELLSKRRQPMSLAQIASALNRTRHELFRMLTCLETRGYLSRDPASGAYSLTLRLYELAHNHSPVDRLVKAADLPMRDLSIQLQESCHLSIIRQQQLMVVAQADSPAPVRISIEVGSQFSLLNTVSGRLLLAHMTAEERDRIIQQPLTRSLAQQLQKIRRQGFSEAANETFLGLHDLAVLVGSPQLGFCAALAISSFLPTDLASARNRRLKKLRACCKAIHQSLGLASLA